MDYIVDGLGLRRSSDAAQSGVDTRHIGRARESLLPGCVRIHQQVSAAVPPANPDLVI